MIFFQKLHIGDGRAAESGSTGVGVGRSRRCGLQSESKLKPVKFCRLRPEVAGPVTYDTFIQMVRYAYFPKHSMTRRGECQCVVKFEASFSDRMPLEKSYQRYFRDIAIAV